MAQKIKLRHASLPSLTSQINNKANANYVRWLKHAASRFDRDNNNIALEGGYGTGKSSILKQLNRCWLWKLINKPKNVSFLSFSIENSSNDSQTISQLLQSEIVRQLYYGESPNKLKGSGYHRIGKTYYLCATASACLIIDLYILKNSGFGLSQLISLSFNDVIPSNLLSTLISPSIILYLSSAAILTMVLNWIFSSLANGRIKHLSSKDLSIELADSKPDFQQLADLLIFYFKRTGRKVIIFEDIDRFDNQAIFEELRQLNLLINNRLWLFGKVKFIYALKDGSISNPEQRAKMFDLVIPVIPFLSKINLPFLFRRECRRIGFTDGEVLKISNLLSRYTSDMRVIKMVIGNFKVYVNSYHPSNVDEYKNCIAMSMIRVFETEEFNKMLSGEGMLDRIYLECNELKQKTNDAEQRATLIMAARYRPLIIAIASDFIEALAHEVGITNMGIVKISTSDTINEYKTITAISAVAMLNADHTTIEWEQYGPILYPRHRIEKIFRNTITNSTAPEVFNWRSKFLTTSGEACMDAFRFLRSNHAWGTNLIVELAREGFITEGYTRFISRVSDSNERDYDIAMRYIHAYIQNDIPNYQYPLNEASVKYILREVNDVDLVSKGMYNYNLFSYMLVSKSTIYNNEVQMPECDTCLKQIKATIGYHCSTSDFWDFCFSYCMSFTSQIHRYFKKKSIDNTRQLAQEIPVIYLFQLADELGVADINEQLVRRAARNSKDGMVFRELLHLVEVYNPTQVTDGPLI